MVCERFLRFSPIFLGEVRNDRAVADAVRKQKPLMELNPRSPAALDCMTIAGYLQSLRENLLKQGAMEEPLRAMNVL
jgi:flagellar biosynthesis protein FlhG